MNNDILAKLLDIALLDSKYLYFREKLITIFYKFSLLDSNQSYRIMVK